MQKKLKTVVCLGFFDGLHIGHKAILRAGAALAARMGAQTAVLTFDIHPLSVITGNSVPLIDSCERRLERLRAFPGVDTVEVLPFDTVLAQTDWRTFFEDILLKKFDVCGVTAGFDYSFGACARGKAGELLSVCWEHGIACEIIPRVTVDGEKAGSSQIRDLIARGEAEQAERLLGRPFELMGTVEAGRKIGRTLGFPTLNMRLQEKIVRPRFGVYVSECSTDGVFFPAITNIGLRPTLGDGTPVVETHMFGGDHGEAYSKTATVRLLKFLRGERRFETPQALKEQVENDMTYAENWFSAREELEDG